MTELVPVELDSELIHEKYGFLKQSGVSLAERAVINNIINNVNPKLMFREDEFRIILINAMIEYRKKSEIPLQKMALLERDKREHLITLLKNTIVESFIPIIKGKKRHQVRSLNAILTEYFNRYL